MLWGTGAPSSNQALCQGLSIIALVISLCMLKFMGSLQGQPYVDHWKSQASRWVGHDCLPEESFFWARKDCYWCTRSSCAKALLTIDDTWSPSRLYESSKTHGLHTNFEGKIQPHPKSKMDYFQIWMFKYWQPLGLSRIEWETIHPHLNPYSFQTSGENLNSLTWLPQGWMT